MKKLLSLLMISLSWVIGMIAVFSFDQSSTIDGDYSSVQTSLDFSQNYELEVSSAYLGIEIPSFKVDWNLFGKFNSEWESFSSSISIKLSHQEYLKRTFVLFDVKKLFQHFFFPW